MSNCAVRRLAAAMLSLSILASWAQGADPFLTGYVFHGNPDAWRLSVRQTVETAARYANSIFSVETYRKGPVSSADRRGRGKRSDIARLFTLANENGLTAYALFYYDYGKTAACQCDPERMGRIQHVVKNMVDDCGPHSSFGGLYFDTVANRHRGCAHCLPGFRDFVQEQYPDRFLLNLGIPGPQALRYPAAAKSQADRFLRAAWAEFTRHTNARFVRKIVDYAHSLTSGVRVLAGIGNLGAPDCSSYVTLPGVLDGVMVDVGINGLLENAMLCDLARSTAKCPVYGSYGMYYDWTFSEQRRARALAIAFAHTDGLVVGDWEHAGPQPERREEHAPNGAENYYWKNSRATWEVFRTTLGSMRRFAEFLAPTESPSEIALLFSERSLRIAAGGPLSSYFTNVAGIYAALTQEHVQADMLPAEGLSAEHLRRYRVVLIPSTPVLSKDALGLLRRWTENGGCLIALGETATRTTWGRTHAEPLFQELVGVTVRDRKIEPQRISARKCAMLPAFVPPRAPVEYRVGHLRAEPTPFTSELACVTPRAGSTVFGRLEDGKPALTVRRVGKGKAIFAAPRFLGLCYEGDRFYDEYAKIYLFPRFSPFPLIKKFRPGVRELIAGLATAALADRGGTLPFEAQRCPDDVELVLRTQHAQRRVILHLTNYGDEEPVGEVVVTVQLPYINALRSVALLDGPCKLKYRETRHGVRLRVTGLRVHAAVVVAYR